MNGGIAEPWVAISRAPNNAIVEVYDVFSTHHSHSPWRQMIRFAGSNEYFAL
jgi:hypothetical protein